MKQYIKIVFLLIILIGCKDDNEELLKELASTPSSVYYSNNNEAIRRVLAIKKGNIGNGWYSRFLITHLSDPHIAEWSRDNSISKNEAKNCKNLKEAILFSNQTKPESKDPLLDINCIVATGDLIGSGPPDSRSVLLARLQAFIAAYNQDNYIPSLYCTGNHDGGCIGDNYIFKNTINSVVTQNLNTPITGFSEENYYYKDFQNPLAGYIRFIVLDMLDQDDMIYDTQNYATFSQKQIDWLCNIALKENMSDRHSVILLTHFPFPSNEFSQKTGCAQHGDFTHNWRMIPEIIESFRCKNTLSATYEDKFHYKNIIVNADFTSALGEFICYLGGHSHISIYFRVTDYSNKSALLPSQLMILAPNQSAEESSSSFNKVHREANTVTSNAFQIYAIDTQEGNVYMTYFGAFLPINDLQKTEIEKLSYR